ncbi:hypothetical protein M5W83_20605 [Paenibacillus thiaminolyticus]|uniref:Uncharacterized protein n=1 Tax=Paenibacillus thiaminolyticus TaxID=49283 RepID=A0AAP9DVA5_PANTH|nr:hypothetical protein [Paenibacillus thiaminolyticus]MCY9538417.1 hypothetical protein [Paenibacillus thiaminolyticus]MCY9604348.1 hypothetical protein [Paenibacillus thiaminolyticus]MCY9609554.1 hypothetical protein [Paenibacillus thiaminolyticus]MCY9615260.1 hypothetical protein [Paenibacillus thiaminolyticus]MCY9621427.1 hypothetical protein [Paenibacillus thiaminolyticus]
MKKVNVLKTGIMVAAMVAALPLSAFAATGASSIQADLKTEASGALKAASMASYPEMDKEQVSGFGMQQELVQGIKDLKLDQRTEKKINDMVASLKPEQITSKKLQEIVKSLKLDRKTDKVLNETIANIIDSQTIKADKTENVKVDILTLEAGMLQNMQREGQDGRVMLTKTIK